MNWKELLLKALDAAAGFLPPGLSAVAALVRWLIDRVPDARVAAVEMPAPTAAPEEIKAFVQSLFDAGAAFIPVWVRPAYTLLGKFVVNYLLDKVWDAVGGVKGHLTAAGPTAVGPIGADADAELAAL